MSFYTKNSCRAFFLRKFRLAKSEQNFSRLLRGTSNGNLLRKILRMWQRILFPFKPFQKFRPMRGYVCLLLLNMNMTDNSV